MKILIAEDDITSRLMLQALMVKWGYEVVAVEDGTKAWMELQKPDSPSIAIIDWQMPGISGVEICRRIRKLERANPIFAFLLTGRDKKGDIVHGLSSGANDYITKPFCDDELKARIEVAERMITTQESLNEKILELKNALTHIKTLQGILPICMHCHKIRNDDEAWERLESYICEHSEAEFSHSVCPSCIKEHYPEYEDDIK